MIALTMLIFCGSFLYAQFSHYRFKNSERTHKDVQKISETLEAKIKSMDEMKTKMESLLLKNGFGR